MMLRFVACLLLIAVGQRTNAKSKLLNLVFSSAMFSFYFASPQPIRPKEASDSDFTIEDVMLWPGMRFSLRSQCKRCSAGRLHSCTCLQLNVWFTSFAEINSVFSFSALCVRKLRAPRHLCRYIGGFRKPHITKPCRKPCPIGDIYICLHKITYREVMHAEIAGGI